MIIQTDEIICTAQQLRVFRLRSFYKYSTNLCILPSRFLLTLSDSYWFSASRRASRSANVSLRTTSKACTFVIGVVVDGVEKPQLRNGSIRMSWRAVEWSDDDTGAPKYFGSSVRLRYRRILRDFTGAQIICYTWFYLWTVTIRQQCLWGQFVLHLSITKSLNNAPQQRSMTHASSQRKTYHLF